ncbi:MAG: FAD-binding protein [Peptococcales bacterium]|jgi:succinate dehydrogenase / fumarate reductase flavoprotein subunit
MKADKNKDILLDNIDILIIGGGSAGLWAANRAKELDENLEVLIVDKGPVDWGGLMSISGGDFEAVLPDENVEDWVKDLVYYYDGLCDQELVEGLLKKSYDRLQDYERLGCQFLRKPDGTLKGIPQRGLNHIKLYPAKYKGRGGAEMVQNLVKEVHSRGVKRIGRTLITDLLKKEGKVIGAVGFDTINGDFYIIKAKAVILATGLTGWKTSYGKNTTAGEGADLAFRAGAELCNFEFGRVWNVPKLFGFEGQTALFPLGARFINGVGEPLMDKYSPVLGANTDPHFTTIAMALEEKAGRGPFILDVSRVNPEDMQLLKPQTGWQLMNYKKLVDLGIDLFKDNTEWNPQLTVSFGGIVADLHGRTSIEGLFAAGNARYIDPGVYMGGFALSTTAVGGYLAGEEVVRYINSSDSFTPEIDFNEVEAHKKDLFALINGNGLTPKEVLRIIQELVFNPEVAIIKNEEALTKALAGLEKVKTDLLPRMSAKDPHYLLKLIEVKTIAFITELYLKASLERKESRAGHYRVDYPGRDDKKFLCWIIAKMNEDGNISFSQKPVPVDKYKYKIEKYYSDNFTFYKN